MKQIFLKAISRWVLTKIFLKAICWFSMVALLLSFSSSPELIARAPETDQLAYQVRQTDQLLKERSELVDSLAFYKEAIRFHYQVRRGRRYREVHVLPGERITFYYRIAEVDPDHPGPDTIYVGKKVKKF